MFDAAVPCRGAAFVGVTTFGRKAQNGKDGEKSATDGRSASRERLRPAGGSLPRDIVQSVAAGPPRPHLGHSGPAATDCARSLSRARIAHADDVPHSPPLGCRRSGRRGPPDRLYPRGGGPCPPAEAATAGAMAAPPRADRRVHGRPATSTGLLGDGAGFGTAGNGSIGPYGRGRGGGPSRLPAAASPRIGGNSPAEPGRSPPPADANRPEPSVPRFVARGSRSPGPAAPWRAIGAIAADGAADFHPTAPSRGSRVVSRAEPPFGASSASQARPRRALRDRQRAPPRHVDKRRQ